MNTELLALLKAIVADANAHEERNGYAEVDGRLIDQLQDALKRIETGNAR